MAIITFRLTWPSTELAIIFEPIIGDKYSQNWEEKEGDHRPFACHHNHHQFLNDQTNINLLWYKFIGKAPCRARHDFYTKHAFSQHGRDGKKYFFLHFNNIYFKCCWRHPNPSCTKYDTCFIVNDHQQILFSDCSKNLSTKKTIDRTRRVS